MQRTKHAALAREFGSRVRALRESLGLSQEELADLASMHRTYIGHIERGEVNPSLSKLVDVADALGVDPAELVQGLKVKLPRHRRS
jgi:transcriptional regulator with XRE-family HTH domain